MRWGNITEDLNFHQQYCGNSAPSFRFIQEVSMYWSFQQERTLGSFH